MSPKELVYGFKDFLESLKPDVKYNSWLFSGKTNIAYGSPGGSWKGQDGYEFKNGDYDFILRSVSSSEEKSYYYYVIESVTLPGQLYNINLNDSKKHRQEEGYSVLLESYAMTAGSGALKRDMVKKAFEEMGYKTNEICKIIDSAPTWERVLNDLLKWGIIRESVKKSILGVSVPGTTSTAPSGINDHPKPGLPPINLILFGPPGTGKTYNTVNKALEIIGESIEGKSRKEIKELFDAKMKEGQIVFTTFHQSMSYEDFIEGIKPIEPEKEGDPVIYRIEYGVFRNLCIEASFAIAQLRETKTTEEVLDFSILYDRFVERIDEKLLIGEPVELETKTGGSVMVESISHPGNLIIKHHQGTRTYTVSKSRLTKLQSAIKDLDDISNINDKFREIIGGSNSSAYWSVLSAIRKEKQTKTVSKENRTYTFDEKKEVVLSLSKEDYKSKNGKPFVLIIDEINRGNVSQIFGELITLIEEDKRLGKDEALEATLPYSKEKFGVPSNLYIIGTMNTADRSVEALDTALRRRFSFEEMIPKPELIATAGNLKDRSGILDDINLPELLFTINRRIEKLIDKDHQIGHSYLMCVSNITDLKLIFQNNIIPLLQEYFFGDFGKIGLVLGSGFFYTTETVKENLFAEFNDYDASEFAERPVYKLKDVLKLTDEEFHEAINLLLKI